MVSLQGQAVPESEDELTFFEAVYGSAVTAYEADVPREDIAAILGFAAATILKADVDEDLETPVAQPDAQPREDCPECGTEITGVRWSIGGAGVVDPCGCDVITDDLPGWIDNV